MNQVVIRMMSKIDEEVAMAKKAFNMNDKVLYQREMDTIHGMLEMLRIVTEKNYKISDNGIKEC